jgi:hypothetical protein
VRRQEREEEDLTPGDRQGGVRFLQCLELLRLLEQPVLLRLIKKAPVRGL